ncbi:Quinol monooxygenase YgiN [Sanguibacter gelidistatuariae]|uniref:Quinol monooxygenase YgiN n=1 Tax=Sanguibacter gelidistatuariae TaxID=1814289 RepID=A0A1G6X6P1_9MICO|nr:putative quinol monooxygenase [Sanguibacter gelidistatuariae]SDD73025.1 Quinol monooxygenase YgiN [Sanguibacter gelidistatuariae]
MIRVVVPATVPVSALPRALELYRELVEETRTETGCISYELLQRADDPTRLLLVEEWESRAHLDAHTRTPHFVRLVALLDEVEHAEPAVIYSKVL